MSLRFTDTRKWQEPWFRKMTPEEKLAYFYLWECCDNAGFIPFDNEAASFQTGVPRNRIAKAWPKLKDRIVIESGWIWVKEFPSLQKNWPLNSKNGAHKQIINLLREKSDYFKSNPEFNAFIAPAKGLLCPPGNGNGNSAGIGFGDGLGNSNGRGQGQGEEIEDINQKLQECAARAEQSSSINPFGIIPLRQG